MTFRIDVKEIERDRGREREIGRGIKRERR